MRVRNSSCLIRRRQLSGASYVDGPLYEYGSRVGSGASIAEFSQRGLPPTVFGAAMALARHPEIVAAIKAADYDGQLSRRR